MAEAHNADEAIKLANQQKFSQITVDLHLGNDSGLTLVAPLRDLQPDARMLVLTGYASIATAVQAVKDGADNYLAKPANVETILVGAAKRSERAASGRGDRASDAAVGCAAGMGAYSARARGERRQYFGHRARVEHASANAAAQAGEAAGEAVSGA